ncbi:unnamed protein product [Parajaminaea phylloscopi]
MAPQSSVGSAPTPSRTITDRLGQIPEAIWTSLTQQVAFVHALRALLCLSVYFIEVGSFWQPLRRCRNQFSAEALDAPIQILILADPQIISTNPHPSYPGRLPRIFFPLHRAFTDRYLQRAWRQLRKPGGATKANDWTATVWLGDLTDTGRLYYHQEGSQELYDRFFRIFPESSGGSTGARNRTFYTPGNHDVSLEAKPGWTDPALWKLYWTLQTREFSRWKFKDLFGTTVADRGWSAEPLYPPTGESHHLIRPGGEEATSLGKYSTKEDHTYRKAMSAKIPLRVTHPDGSAPSTLADLVLLDTTDILAMQRQGKDPFQSEPPASGEPGKEADWRTGGAWWFLNSLKEEQATEIPRILFTHVPLFRGADSSCALPEELRNPTSNTSTLAPGLRYASHPAVHRWSSARNKVVPGSDAEGTYENLVGSKWSRFILERASPAVIFTGDDHDVCHALHTRSQSSAQRWTIPELTVPAMGMTSGVARPGYARLAVWSETEGRKMQTKIEYAACDLPDQIRAWATSYPILLVATLAVVLIRKRWATKRLRILGARTPSASHDGARSANSSSDGSKAQAAEGLFVLDDDDDDGDDEDADAGKGAESVPMLKRSRQSLNRQRKVQGSAGHSVDAAFDANSGDKLEFEYDVERLAAAPSVSPSSMGRATEREDDATGPRDIANKSEWKRLGHLSGAAASAKRSRRAGSASPDGGLEEVCRSSILSQYITVAWPVALFWLLFFLAGF